MSCCEFYSGAQNGTNCYQLYDKTQLSSDICTISKTMDEAINARGQKIDYYVNTYNLLSADNIYGEQPTSKFFGPTNLKFIVELNENAANLSRFGFAADDEITAYVTYTVYICAFANTTVYQDLNQDIEPKSGDVFCMSEYGRDRIGKRAGNYFQITQRTDQDISAINPLGGHYMWRIKAKRLEYSFEPGLSGETGNDQVFDDDFQGKITSTIMGELSSPSKIYSTTADTEVEKFIPINTSQENTDIYGYYN